MKCIEVKENLGVFLDDEIILSESGEIKTHLANCISCQTEFESLQFLSKSLKANLFAANLSESLDEKVLSAFQNFHSQKQTEENNEKLGWFGIPKLALATAFLLLALFSGLAFQIGRISASNVEITMPESSKNNQKNFDEQIEQQSPKIKIVEVPVIKEKIVEVPVIKEKIITRTVYLEKKTKDSNPQNVSSKDTFAINSSVKDGEYLTTTNLEGYQPVSEIKVKISKKEEEK